MAEIKNALITGADSNAIAMAVALELASEGYDITLIVESAAFVAPQGATRMRVERTNFTDDQDVTALLERLAERRYAVIINAVSALACDSDGALLNEGMAFNVSEFNRTLLRNVTSVSAICLGLRHHLEEGARIINITSSAALEGAFATISYNAGKAAVHNLTQSLANVLGVSRGVTVNCVAPGWIPPSPDAAAAGVVALADALTPSRTVGRPEHVLEAIKYLRSNAFANGTILPVHGGITSSCLPYMMEYLELSGRASDVEINGLAARLGASKRALQ